MANKCLTSGFVPRFHLWTANGYLIGGDVGNCGINSRRLIRNAGVAPLDKRQTEHDQPNDQRIQRNAFRQAAAMTGQDHEEGANQQP
jgi:hypothetical protein